MDDTSHVSVSLADVEIPNHVRFTQYVFRIRRCAMTVLDPTNIDQFAAANVRLWEEIAQSSTSAWTG